jgi:hypothetical protein
MDELSAADWLVGSGWGSDAEPMRLITFGPPGFAAYARLRFIPDPAGPGLSEADVFLPEDHPSEIEQSRIALRTLASGSEAADCYFCVWEGYTGSFLSPELTRGPLVTLPHRRYVLFAGPLAEVERWEDHFGAGRPCPPPAFAWPADHAWCFTSDVDPHWAGIAASAAAVTSLTTHPSLDVVPASPDRPPQAYDS